MSDKEITTAAIADFVKAHGPIALPAVGKHFGQPFWTSEIQRAAKPLIESGQITISAEQGVVWVESPEPKRIETQQGDSDPPKDIPLPDLKESLTDANAASFSGETREKNEVFSFFRRGDQSKHSDRTGDITQLHEALTSHEGWKRKIEYLRSLPTAEQPKAKSELPAFTPSILITSESESRVDGKDAGAFKHTDLIQADFDEAPDFDKLFDALRRDPHARLIFRSPRGKVKALIKVTPVATASDHTAAFESVRSYCLSQGYGEIDGKPKNINCLCYISHDPSAVIKEAQPLEWLPLSPTAPRAAPTDYEGEPTDITDWLKAHRVIIRDTRNHNGNLMYLVDCPWESEHTQDFGHKDTAVFVDPTNGKWCFNCFHDHCDHRSWKEYRQAVAPKDETYTPPKRKPLSKSKRRLLRTQQLYGGRR